MLYKWTEENKYTGRGFGGLMPQKHQQQACARVNQNKYMEQHKSEPHEQIYLRIRVLATWLSVISPLRRQNKLLWAASRKI